MKETQLTPEQPHLALVRAKNAKRLLQRSIPAADCVVGALYQLLNVPDPTSYWSSFVPDVRDDGGDRHGHLPHGVTFMVVAYGQHIGWGWAANAPWLKVLFAGGAGWICSKGLFAQRVHRKRAREEKVSA